MRMRGLPLTAFAATLAESTAASAQSVNPPGSGPILASIVTSAKVADSANMQSLRSLHHVKSFIASPVMLLLFDVPLAPIYFGAVFQRIDSFLIGHGPNDSPRTGRRW